MRRKSLILIFFVSLLPGLIVMRAQAQVSSCAPAEFLEAFELVVDYQQRLAEPPVDFASLMDYSRRYAADREGSLLELPPCDEASALGGLLVELGGDFAARAALELAGTPPSANPYRSLPSAADRINDMLAQTLGPPPSQASADSALPACAPEDLDAYAAARDELLTLLATPTDLSSRDAFTMSLIERLAWRAQTLPGLPICAETVFLNEALIAAATDSAASLSFAFVGVPAAQNPFLALSEASLASVTAWRASSAPGLEAAVAAPYPADARSLPACSRSQLGVALRQLRDAYREAAESDVDPLNRSQTHLDIRTALLVNLPICAEIYTASWWLDAWLGAPGSQSQTRLDAALSALNSARADAPAISQSAPCSIADMRYFSVYIAPAFHSLMRRALAVGDFEGQAELRGQSGTFRDFLWEYAPPCEEAAELSLLMRRIAADFDAMLALEAAGQPALDIPYLLALPGDLAELADRLAEMNAAFGFGESQIWFVDIQGYANVRSCGSTTCGVVAVVRGGDPLDVVDDSGEWLEVRLPSGGKGFIAAFLASETPPN